MKNLPEAYKAIAPKRLEILTKIHILQQDLAALDEPILQLMAASDDYKARNVANPYEFAKGELRKLHMRFDPKFKPKK